MQFLDRAVPGKACEVTICVELLLGVFLLFGDRGCARILTVVLVHRQGDYSNHASRFKGYHHVVEATWWAAIGRAAPAAYQLRGDEVLRVRVQNVAGGR